jgi:hypothetical protein
MGTVLLSLLPLIIAASILPMWFIISLLLIRSEHGLPKAAAFSLGAMIVRVLQGLLVGLVAREASDEPTTKGLIAAIVLMLLGIALWGAAVVTWCREHPRAGPPPKWLGKLTKISALHAFGVGAVLMAFSVKPLVFTVSAITTIDQANLNPVLRVIAFLIFVIGAQSLVLSPVIISTLMPDRATRMLDATQQWLERNNKVLTILLSVIFGSWFFYKGTNDLFRRHHPSPPPSLQPQSTSGAPDAAS